MFHPQFHRYAVAVTVLSIIATTPATASLYPRGDGVIVAGGSGECQLIYDSQLNVTWLDYTTVALPWQDQNHWAADLSVTFNGTTFDRWRLPHMLPLDGVNYNFTPVSNVSYYDGSMDRGYNISAPGSAYSASTAHEFAHLFYTTLGNVGRHDLVGNSRSTGWNWVNTGPFANLQNVDYWIGTDVPYPGDVAECRFVYDGNTDIVGKDNPFAGLAVMDGDVGLIPEPSLSYAAGAMLMVILCCRRSTPWTSLCA